MGEGIEYYYSNPSQKIRTLLVPLDKLKTCHPPLDATIQA